MIALLQKFFQPRVKYGLIILSCLAAIFLANNMIFGRHIRGIWGNYALPSLLWVMLALGIHYLLPAARTGIKPRHRRIICWAAFLCALAGLGAVFAVGLFEGLGKSPYDQSIRGIVINLFYLGSLLAGMELSRAWIINYLFKKRPVLGVALSGLLFTFFSFSPGRLFSFQTALDGAMFAGNIFLPTLSENLLASYLALLGGALPAVIYRGTLFAVQWFSPVLPDLSWVIRAFVGTFVPAFCMVLLYQLYQSEVLRIRKKEKESPVGWVAASTVSVLMVWFTVGVFSFFPNVIITGSMSPEIEVGDIVIVKRISPEEVELGDVIQFQKENIRINHRVMEIQEDERGLPLFITRGDANPNPDSDPVLAEELVGKTVKVIPKIGWITLRMRGSG